MLMIQCMQTFYCFSNLIRNTEKTLNKASVYEINESQYLQTRGNFATKDANEYSIIRIPILFE